MDEQMTVSILDIDLIESYYKTINSDVDDYNVTINYTIQEDNVVEFDIDLSAEDNMFRLDAKYVFIIKISNVDDLEKFIGDNKEQLIYPVYTKVSQLISNLTDQSYPFPQIVSPFHWIDEEDDAGD